VIDPASGAVVAEVAGGPLMSIWRWRPRAGPSMTALGLHEARAARRLLLRLAELMERDAQVLAELEVIDNGRSCPWRAMAI
jgi:phenylacetaldehyde dehydrogenase